MEGNINKGINVSGVVKDITNIPTAPIKTNKDITLKETFSEALKKGDGLTESYKESKVIKIALTSDIGVYSVYRQVNRTHIHERRDTIGGSIRSAKLLASNTEEMNAYMPGLIGCSTADPKFAERVARWFQNISVPVPADGVEFNCNFFWKHKEDYLRYSIKEQELIERYDNADRSTPKLLKEAIANYVRDLNDLESTRCLYGRPENVDHYLTYRHCLLYSDIAKDILVVHFNPSIRFYIRDEQREQNRAKRVRIQSNKARRNYLDLLDDSDKFRAMFVCYCSITGLDIVSNLNVDESVQQRMVDEYAIKEPEKFNKLFNSSTLSTQAFIEELIAKGELIRSDVNQTILTPEAVFIGSNMKEAIAYFDAPVNKEFRKGLEIKIRL